MRTRELIRLMPTQFKRVDPSNPLIVGHHMPLLGTWTKDDGYIKEQSLSFQGEALACPIVAVIEKKMGNNDVTLKIKARVAEFDSNVEEERGEYTVNRKKYKTTETTTISSFTIPRHTRPYATWVITGLGQKIYEIISITDNVDYDDGKVSFYALASNGSKIIYWLGIHNLSIQLRNILRPWIAPSKCTRCNATGIDPTASYLTCKQCMGYKYDGYSSIGYVQKNQGFDVGLARELVDDWDNMSNSEHNMIRKFINTAWTQKWWVTPTKSEIRRIFSHFYMIEEDEIIITERFNAQEPVWRLELPLEADVDSPFGRTTEADRELMQYIAESITPAGVSVFVGFYERYFLGDFSDFEDYVITPVSTVDSWEALYCNWNLPRWDFWNGWTEATRVFEVGIQMSSSGDVAIFNANDQNRHVCRLRDNAYVETGFAEESGYFDLWVHPQDTTLRIGLREPSQWLFYVEFASTGFFDHFGNIITLATPSSDYHIHVEFGASGNHLDVLLQNDLLIEDIQYLNSPIGASGATYDFRVESIGIGDGFIDAIGLSSDPNYESMENWRRLYEWGWGLEHVNELSGEDDLFNDYFVRDRFFVI